MDKFEVPHAVWAKLDLIYEKVQKTDLAVAALKGDNQVQNAVLQDVAEKLKEFKAETKVAIEALKTESREEITEVSERLAQVEKWQNRLIAVGSAVMTGFMFFGDAIRKAVIGVFNG